MMNGPTLVSIVTAATFFFATILSLNLAVAIYRRAEKSFLVDNLVVILLLFAFESATSLSHGIYGTVLGLDEKARLILAHGAYSVRIAAIAVIVYFILSATRCMICNRTQFPDASPLFVFMRSELLLPLLGLALSLSAVAAVTEQIWLMGWIMRHADSARIPLPPLYLQKPAGIVIGFLGGIGILAQLLTLAYTRYQRMPGQTKTERLQHLLRLKPQKRVIYLREGFRTSNASLDTLHADEWKSWYYNTMLMLVFGGNHVIRAGQPRSMLDIFWFVIAFGFVLSLLYFKMRFVFFDVIIKRGLLLAGLVIAIGSYWYFVLLPFVQSLFAANIPAAQILL
jgi:hypothetical protein